MSNRTMIFYWNEVAMGEEQSGWAVDVDKGKGRFQVAKGKTLAEALERAMIKFGIRVLDRATWPPGKVANFSKDSNLVRNVAVLRTGLHSLYTEVKKLEENLPNEAHSSQDFNVNGISALLAVKFDWFSVSILNLMEGVSLLDTLAHRGDYAQLASSADGMNLMRSQAKEYVQSIPEAAALRLWRDKVAAHRSGIFPPLGKGASDSLTTKFISLMGAQVMTKNGRYMAPGGIPHGAWQGPSKPELKEWSLTKTWESLASERYEWLNNGSFFDDVSALNLGPGGSIHNFSLVSGEEAIKEFRAKHLVDSKE